MSSSSPMVVKTPGQPRRLGPLGLFVDRRVTELQRGLQDGRPTAVAALARLRRGVGKEVGVLPDLWRLTLDGLPEPEFRSDKPTRDERAAYTAITLYALHQQSRTKGMHEPGIGLGTAVARLARIASAAAVQRRFEALGTAESFPEVVHHARGLITQLRGANLGLDYGRFADELCWLQQPGSAARVRLAWGRDFYRNQRTDNTDLATGRTDNDHDPEEDA